MESKLLSFKLGRFVVNFIAAFDSYVIPVVVLETLLGYRSGALIKAALAWEGRKLLDFSEKSKVGFRITDTILIEKFIKKHGETFQGLDAKNELLLVTPEGFARILKMSNSTGAKNLRTEVYKNEKFRTFINLPLPKTNKNQSEFNFSGVPEGDSLKNVLYALEQFQKLGFSQAEVKQMGKRVMDILGSKLAQDLGVQNYLRDQSRATSQSIGIGHSIVSTPKGDVQIFNGTSHPAWEGYLPASIIAARYGLKTEQVKADIKTFCNSHGHDLPNNLAKKFVTANNGNFPEVDAHGYIVFRHPSLDAIAVWAGMEGNTFNWRNFWSPKSVEAISALIEKRHGVKPVDQNGAIEKVVEAPSKMTVNSTANA